MSTIQNLNPAEAWKLMQHTPEAVLLDVRDPMEFLLVGHPVGAINITWKFAPDWRPNTQFVAQVRERVPHSETTVFLICRSGQRSLDAAKALHDAGYSDLINIDEGFEGALDANKQRGKTGGWRFNALPWEQT